MSQKFDYDMLSQIYVTQKILFLIIRNQTEKVNFTGSWSIVSYNLVKFGLKNSDTNNALPEVSTQSKVKQSSLKSADLSVLLNI